MPVSPSSGSGSTYPPVTSTVGAGSGRIPESGTCTRRLETPKRGSLSWPRRRTIPAETPVSICSWRPGCSSIRRPSTTSAAPWVTSRARRLPLRMAIEVRDPELWPPLLPPPREPRPVNLVRSAWVLSVGPPRSISSFSPSTRI